MKYINTILIMALSVYVYAIDRKVEDNKWSIEHNEEISSQLRQAIDDYYKKRNYEQDKKI